MTAPGARTGAALLAAAASLAPLAGCWGPSDWNPLATRTEPAVPVVATPVDPDAVSISEPTPRIVRFRVMLPVQSLVPAGGVLKLRFAAPLNGAKVDAFVEGPRQRATVLHGKRTGGDTIAVPLAPGSVDTVDVWVHRHLRPPPIVRDVVLECPRDLAQRVADGRRDH